MRIDAARGRVLDVRPRGASLAAVDASPIAEGVAAVAGALRKREQEAAAREADRQGAEDLLALAEKSSNFRIELTKDFDERSSQYDGSAPGFSDAVREDYQGRIDAHLADVPERIAGEARLRLAGVVDNFSLAAINYESSQREANLLRGVIATVDGEALAVQSDGASLPLARDNVDLAIEAAPAAVREKLQEQSYARLGNAALTDYETKSPSQGLAALARGEFNDYLKAEDQAKWKDQLTREIERRRDNAERAAEKTQRVAAASVKEELADIDRLRDLGLPVSDERYDALERVAAGAGADTMRDVSERREANRVAEAVKQAPLEAAVSFVSNLRASLQSQADAPRASALQLDAAQKALSGMRERLGSDALAFAAENRGGVDPLDLANPVAGLKKRAAQAKEAADYYGAPVRFFTNDELDALTTKLDESPENRRLFIDAAAAAGAPAMLAELAPKAPQIAHLAGLTAMGGERAFVDDALSGGDLKKSGDHPSTIDTAAGNRAAPAIEEAVLGSAFALRPSARQNVIAAARLAYEASSARQSRAKEDFDGKEYKALLQKAAGAVGDGADRRGGLSYISVHGQTRDVWVPNWIAAAKFPTFYKKLSDDDWRAAGGEAYDADGRSIPASELRRGFPVAVDNGVYQIDLGRNAGAPQWAADEKGEPYRLDLNKVRAAILNEKGTQQ